MAIKLPAAGTPEAERMVSLIMYGMPVVIAIVGVVLLLGGSWVGWFAIGAAAIQLTYAIWRRRKDRQASSE